MQRWELLFRHPILFCTKQIRKIEKRKNEKIEKIEIDEDKRKYQSDVEKYIRLNQRDEFAFDKKYEYPFISDWRKDAGYPGGYFWMDYWGAKNVIANHPKEHYDIGSRIDGFVSHMMLFPDIKLHIIDVRPLSKPLPGVHFCQADATNLENIADESIESLSALCSFEHFGLGRYGDPIDPEACFKAFKASQRVVKRGGYIYICVPVGCNRVYFNAHRVFHPQVIIDEYDQCECIEMSVIDPDADPVLRRVEDPMNYAPHPLVDCLEGLFIFRKR